MIVYRRRTEQQMSLRGSDSDRGNLLQVSGSDIFSLLRGYLMGIATSHFVLLAMTCILITAPLNDHLQYSIQKENRHGLLRADLLFN